MNNNPVNGVPNVPAANNNWVFYTNLRGCAQDFGANDEVKAQHRLARRTLLNQLHLMAATRCKACSGYGHRARDCPTNMRLGMLSSSTNEWKTLIAYARKRTEVTEIERMADRVQQ